MLLAGKSILITGASGGIGQGIALAAAEEGADVILSHRSIDRLDDSTRLLEERGYSCSELAMDVTHESEIRAGVERVVDQYGRLDGLVNNAAVFVPGPSLEVSRENLEQHLEVNVTGLFLCCQVAALQMKDQDGGGRIVNISSNAAKVGFPSYVPYSASKAAVNNLTQTLAKEWAPLDINVNAVCPGGVDTPMLHEVAAYISEQSGEEPEAVLDRLHPPQLGRHVKPIEVGRVVSFLLSDHARIIRGQSISVDAGETPF